MLPKFATDDSLIYALIAVLFKDVFLALRLDFLFFLGRVVDRHIMQETLIAADFAHQTRLLLHFLELSYADFAHQTVAPLNFCELSYFRLVSRLLYYILILR